MWISLWIPDNWAFFLCGLSEGKPVDGLSELSSLSTDVQYAQLIHKFYPQPVHKPVEESLSSADNTVFIPESGSLCPPEDPAV